MAKRGDEDDDDKRPESADGEPEEGEQDEDERDEDASASEPEDDSDEERDSDEEDDSDEDDDSDEEEDDDEKAASESDDSATASEEDDGSEEDGVAAAQLGVQRYVYTAYFSAVIIGGYLLGRTFDAIWARLADSRWIFDNAHVLTTVPEETRSTYSLVAAGIVAILIGLQTFRKESVRTWTEDVAGELMKVKWPNRKEVYASTVVVLATSAVAVTYLFLLDRFWGFVTDKIYGIGS